MSPTPTQASVLRGHHTTDGPRKYRTRSVPQELCPCSLKDGGGSTKPRFSSSHFLRLEWKEWWLRQELSCSQRVCVLYTVHLQEGCVAADLSFSYVDISERQSCSGGKRKVGRLSSTSAGEAKGMFFFCFPKTEQLSKSGENDHVLFFFFTEQTQFFSSWMLVTTRQQHKMSRNLMCLCWITRWHTCNDSCKSLMHL